MVDGLPLRTEPKLERVERFLTRDFNDVVLPHPLAGRHEVQALLDRRAAQLDSFRHWSNWCTALRHPVRYRAIVKRKKAHADVARHVDVHEKGAHEYRIYHQVDEKYPLSQYGGLALGDARVDYILGPNFNRNQHESYVRAQAMAREQAGHSAAYWDGRFGKHGIDGAPDAEVLEGYGDYAPDYLEGRNQAKWVTLLAQSARGCESVDERE